jgi:uncharacterized protein (TIGR01777 family)
MKLIITGASGFIGTNIIKILRGKYDFIALTTHPDKAYKLFPRGVDILRWDGKTIPSLNRINDQNYAFINLAGHNIASRRWTDESKKLITQSRLDAANAVADFVRSSPSKPEIVIQASAIGYYGSRADELLDELSEKGKGFLSDLCEQLESIIADLENHSVRYANCRISLVLGPEGGALPKIVKPFKYYLGGKLGSASQWMSWIAVNDLVNAIDFLIENKEQKGTYNFASPEPVTNADFTGILSKTINTPALMTVPCFVLKALFGQMAQETILSSQRVLPKRLLDAGFEFRYNHIAQALKQYL